MSKNKMLFNTILFIFLFLPIVMTGFFAFARSSEYWGVLWMALSSLVFYGCWDYRYVPLLLFSIVSNFYASRLIEKASNPTRKRLLVVSIIFNLSLLGYYKYANFILSSLNYIGGTAFEQPGIVLPIGISFFTFTQIAFLVDAYSRKVTEYRFSHYLLFVTYFPHLVAGPVLHHKEMMPQFGDKLTYEFSFENIAVGFSIFVIGLAKKVLLADNIAPMANSVFQSGVTPGLIEAWVGVVAYTLQLYFDFSGYSDMAIGLSRLFGVRLPLNFNSPYKAENIMEFWRRWHMTLSRFLRDYLYIPLGGNRSGPVARYFNLMVTMLLGGLWHGAGWTFVIWGGLHGVFIGCNHFWHFIRRSVGIADSHNAFGKLMSRSLTLLVVMIAWVFFRSPDISTAYDVLLGMVGLNGLDLPSWSKVNLAWLSSTGIEVRFNGIRWVDISSRGPPLLLVALFVALFFPNTQEIMADMKPCLEAVETSTSWRFYKWRSSWLWVLILTFLFLSCIFSLNNATEFLYFQF